jgi:hypothetical protein
VVNLSNNVLQGEIVGKYEILGSYTQYPIREDNRGKLKNIMLENPPVREMYPGNKNLQYHIPIPTVHATQISWNEKVEKSDKTIIKPFKRENKILESDPKINKNPVLESDLNIEKEVLGGSKVTYTGEADISPQIIDAGLEIPTLIHKSQKRL